MEDIPKAGYFSQESYHLKSLVISNTDTGI